jgi:hypothetical protein
MISRYRFPLSAAPVLVAGLLLMTTTGAQAHAFEVPNDGGLAGAVAITPQLSLSTDKKSYVANDIATITVDISGSDSRQVTVTSTRAGHDPVTIFSGTIPTGGLTLHVRMRETKTFTASTPADATHDPAETSLLRPVRIRVSTVALYPERRAGGIVYFRQPRRPRFQSNSRPPRPLSCFYFEVQRRVDGTWQTVQRSPCRMTGPTVGRAIWRFTHSHQRGATYRERASFAGDALNTAGASRWKVFRFE